MGKGLGQIIAAASMDAQKQAVESGMGVACPFCGQAMEFNGAAWFCASGSRGMSCSLPDEDSMRGRFLNAPKGRGGWQDGYSLIDPQPGDRAAIFAGVVVDGMIIARFDIAVVGARQNWRVWSDNDTPVAAIPALIRTYGWTWCDWVFESQA